MSARTVVYDTKLDRTGTITTVSQHADGSWSVLVSWRPGQVTRLRPEDIRAGRYKVEVRP